MRADAIRITGLRGVPEIEPGNDLAATALAALQREHVRLDDGDVVVFTQKIVSKAEGRVVTLDTVQPSQQAREWADTWRRDARVIQLALDDAVRIVRMERGIIITETPQGFICANSGIDTSNVRPGEAVRLPEDPDASARRLCSALRTALGTRIGVIVSDTFGRPWREGQADVAIGVAGMRAVLDYRGSVDTFGQPLRSTAIAVADELAAAAELAMGKTLGIPIVVVQGTGLGTGEIDAASGRDLLRPPGEDMFR
jgi:coenzyme F420-0:L-glutamate ligase/coenzyme F420-1:gamma-L-glutamate ligase